MDSSESQTSKETEQCVMKMEMASSSSTSVSATSKPAVDKHICTQCGKQFNKRDFLQKHKIVHEIPRHKCGACDKSFVREDKLKRHFTSIHSKHRPHICEVCSKAFARKDKLKDHQKHHVTAGNSFQCAECSIPFVQKSDLNRHCRGIHKGEPGIGINIPSKRFVKSKPAEDAASAIGGAQLLGPELLASQSALSDESLKAAGAKPALLGGSFYAMPGALLPPADASGAISEHVSKGLLKPPGKAPLKAELNYGCSSSAPPAAPAVSAPAAAMATAPPPSLPPAYPVPAELFEKENVQVKFKSKRSGPKSKLFKPGARRSRPDRMGGSGSSSAPHSSRFAMGGAGKADPTASSPGGIGCLSSQGAPLYPHLPIITPFQSPMISVFPSTSDFYSRSLGAPYKPGGTGASLASPPGAGHAYNPSFPMDPHASTALACSSPSSTSLSSSSSAAAHNASASSLKPPPSYALGANNITFAHQNLYQFQQNQLRYYSYLQPGSPLFGQHSSAPLTANIYPYMPF